MITNIDFNILDAIQKIANPVLDVFFALFTHLGDGGILWILIAVLCLCFKKTRKCGLMMAIALIVGTVIGNLALKNIIARPRPFVQNPQMLSLLKISTPPGFSCPSGHTLASFESAVVIYLNNKKWGIAALIVAAIIGFSRMYFYVHFLTDVLFGMALGIGIGIAVYYLTLTIERKMNYGKKI